MEQKEIEYSYNSKKKRLRTFANGLLVEDATASDTKKCFAKLIEEKPESSKK